LIVIFSGIILSGLFFLISFFISSKTGSDLFKRYSSALMFTGLVDIENAGENGAYSDSGHLNQSLLVTEYFFNNYQRFWGGGINRRDENYLFIEGQSKGGVHSNIVSMWQYFGIPGVFYFIYLFIYNFIYFIKSFKKRKMDTILQYICFTISLYFIIRFIVGWFSGDFFFMYYRIAFQIFILIIIFRFFSLNIKIKLNKNARFV